MPCPVQASNKIFITRLPVTLRNRSGQCQGRYLEKIGPAMEGRKTREPGEKHAKCVECLTVIEMELKMPSFLEITSASYTAILQSVREKICFLCKSPI